MTREKFNLAIGLAMDADSVQITYFHTGMRSLESLTRSSAAMTEDVWKAACGLGKPIDLLVSFFREALSPLDIDQKDRNVHIMVTVPRLDYLLSQRIAQALTMIGLDRKNVYMQDYLSSFYHYVIRQRRDLWSQDVVLLTYNEPKLFAYVMHVDWTKAPSLATIKLVHTISLDERARDGRDDKEWDLERDRLFFEFLKKAFERRNVSTCYLVGSYFSQSWAQKSFQYLCSGRHAFAGDNLYTRGACYAAAERAQIGRKMQDLLYLGADVLHDNLTMPLRVRGKETNHLLVSAGINWYEAHCSLDVIPDGEDAVTVYSTPMTGGTSTAHVLRLEHFPKRPDRATRLRLTLYFTAPDQCSLEVEDLGFGGLYASSGKKWSRKITLR